MAKKKVKAEKPMGWGETVDKAISGEPWFFRFEHTDGHSKFWEARGMGTSGEVRVRYGTIGNTGTIIIKSWAYVQKNAPKKRVKGYVDVGVASKAPPEPPVASVPAVTIFTGMGVSLPATLTTELPKTATHAKKKPRAKKKEKEPVEKEVIEKLIKKKTIAKKETSAKKPDTPTEECLSLKELARKRKRKSSW